MKLTFKLLDDSSIPPPGEYVFEILWTELIEDEDESELVCVVKLKRNEP